MPYGLPNISYIGYPVPLPCAAHAGLGLREARPADAPAIAAHLRALDPGDRRNRFCATVSDAALDAHVAGLWGGDRLLIAAHDGPLWPGPFHAAGPMRALAEVVLAPGAAEIALTVEDGLRRRGIGTWLVQVAGRLLAPRGIARLDAWTLPENAAFLGLARRAGARIAQDRDQVEIGFDTAALGRAYLRRRAADALRLAG